MQKAKLDSEFFLIEGKRDNKETERKRDTPQLIPRHTNGCNIVTGLRAAFTVHRFPEHCDEPERRPIRKKATASF